MPKSTVVRRIDLSRASGGGGGVLSGGGGTTYTTDHGALSGLGDDDHAQYYNQSRGDARYALRAVTLTAGNGLTGGGDLTASRTFAVGAGDGLTVSADAIALTTPGGLSVSSANSAAGAHTHAITASDTVSAAQTALLKATSGALTVATFGATTSVTTPSLLASGNLSIDAAGGNVTFDYDDALKSDNYTAGFPLAGWRMGPTSASGQSGLAIGSLEADELRARTFVADETRVDRGQEYVTKSYGVLSRSFTSPINVNGEAYIYFENSPHIAGALFTSADWVLLRYLDMSSGITLTSVWGQLTSYYTTGLTGEQRWTFTLREGTGGYEFAKGAMAVNFGASGQGYILSDAVSSTAPFVQVGKWATNPYTPANRTVHAQMGRLDGLGFTGEYGFAATKDNWTTAGTWWKASSGGVAQNNVDSTWYKSGVRIASIDATDGIQIAADETFTDDRTISFLNGSGTFGGVRAYSIGGVAPYNWAELMATYTGNRPPVASVYAWGTNTYPGSVQLVAYGSFAASVTLDAPYGSTPSSLTITAATTSVMDLTANEIGFDADGSVSDPAIQWSTDTNTGIYRVAADTIGVTVGGTQRLQVDTGGVDVTGTFDVTGTSTLAAVNASGNVTLTSSAPTLNVGSSAVSTGTCSLQIGDGRTGNGYAVFDMVGDATYSDYGFRILRGNSGANTTTQLLHRGTGNFSIVAQDAASMFFQTAATTRMSIGSTGEVAINTTPQSGWELYVSGDIGATGVINGPLRMAGSAPATSTSSGSVGDMRYNSTHLFICVATDSWRRVTLSTF